ncbi:MAG TPA: DUF4142 domain-containing protein [Chitinophagaceae bacterium]|nr:DUF4142 domain-containing protein [Chitinophagaceae bacterium]
MKRITAFLLIAGLCLTACNTNNNKKNSVDSAKEANEQNDTSNMTTNTRPDTMTATPVNKDVSDFAVDAASGSLMEVELGKIAQEKATNPRIKDFAAMVVKDHSNASDNLKKLASEKNIILPAAISDEQKKDIDNLNKKTGKDFDKAYMKMMLDDHKKDIKKFEKAGNDLKDPDIKGFAMNTLPTLQKHLDSAKAINKQ